VLCVFFWVFPRRQILVSRRFGTLCQFHLQRLDVIVLRKIYGVGKYGAEGDIWCWRLWC
jgi:hypothetical protein